jgi:hypothetical protein
MNDIRDLLSHPLRHVTLHRYLTGAPFQVRNIYEGLCRMSRKHPLSPVPLRGYNKSALVIVDEVGYTPIDREECNLFFRFIAARYEKASTIITSNKAFSRQPCRPRWYFVARDRPVPIAFSRARQRRQWRQGPLRPRWAWLRQRLAGPDHANHHCRWNTREGSGDRVSIRQFASPARECRRARRSPEEKKSGVNPLSSIIRCAIFISRERCCLSSVFVI